MPDPRRFSDRQRAVLAISTGGRCARCRDPLRTGWHADHVTPWSCGGPTALFNGQPLCPTCNLAKGDRMPTDDLRPWQREALPTLTDPAATDRLVVACPGAGKTRLALAALTDPGRHHDQVVVVVPSEQLKLQWAQAAARVGLELLPSWRNGDGVWPSDFDGVVVTYQQVASMPEVLQMAIANRSTSVVLDEIHHTRLHARWGEGIATAFDQAQFRLALSGTPFRSDGAPIPFIGYRDGLCVADVTYGFDRAIADQVCRPVTFPQYGGRFEWWIDGAVERATFDDPLTSSGESQRLRTALHPEGDFLTQVLADANTQLTRRRRGADSAPADPAAGGLVLAIDQDHARQIAHKIAEITGTGATVVTSDEPDASQRIARFAEGDARWLVAVKMVSEGVDIPRLRILVWATNVLTEMFFRQAVGRVVRVDTSSPVPVADQDALVYLPDDLRLRQMARTLREEVNVPLGEPADETDGGPEERDELSPATLGLFTPLSAEPELVAITFDAQRVEDRLLAAARRYAPAAGFSDDPRDLSRIARLIALLDDGAALDRNGSHTSARPGSSGVSTAGPNAAPKHQRTRILRDRNAHAARIIGKQYEVEFSHVNRHLNQLVGVESVSAATEDQLQRRLEFAQRWMETGSPAAIFGSFA